MGWTSLQERFERTSVGRILISLFLIVTFVTLLTANLPESRLQSVLLDADRYYVYGAGLDESWGVFAPDPRREVIEVSARVAFADGSTKTFHVRKRDPVIGEYVDYRWLKWVEYVVSPASADQLWKPAAAYFARKLATPSKRPVRVSLHERWYDLQPPGEIHGPILWQQRDFYTTAVTESMLRGPAA